MLDSKLLLPYKDDEGRIRDETVLATKEGGYYRIKSIPVRASKIALYDLIDDRKRDWLDQGEREQRWGYREACLSHE